MSKPSPLVDPFSISPNPNYLYVTPSIQSAVFKVKRVITYKQGLTCILGGWGMGKSTILRFIFTDFDIRDDVHAVLIPTPNFASEFAFLKGVAGEFNLPLKKSILDQEKVLKGFLIEQHLAGKTVVLFLDEAQRLSNKMLEVVRSMLNFETDSAKLIQIVLSGQLELRTRLIRSEMGAITSRIIMPTLLNALSPDEVKEMIEFRCSRVGITCPFTPDAFEAIYNATDGIPREVLKVCGTAYAFMELTGAAAVDAKMIPVAIEEGILNPKAQVAGNDAN